MKSKFALAAIVAATAVFAQTAFAQASAPVTRDERKAETAAAQKSGQLTPAGQGNVSPTPSKSSDKTRDERKAQTKADEKAGKIAPAGDAGGQKEDKAMKSTGTETTRDERKTKTKQQQKNKELKPAGEGAK